MKTDKKQVKSTIRIYTDGAGSRPDGKGSGYVWFRPDNNGKKNSAKTALLTIKLNIAPFSRRLKVYRTLRQWRF